MYERLSKFIIEHNILINSQCDFRSDHNTQHAILDICIYLFLFYFHFATRKQHSKELIKTRKEEERMMTIVARRPKGNNKAYVS